MEDRLHQQQNEFAQKERKDRLLVMRLATKEQELQELANQLTEMTKGQAPGSSQLRSALLDPALNLIFQRMRKELEDKTKALQQAQDDMSAWKFTADSQMGKRLMSRCRTLIQENQELGKQVSAGRTARLETELALQKKYSEELKGSQDEMNDFVIELDEEVVGMQSTICALQQQLKEAKQEVSNLKSVAVTVNPSMPSPPVKEEPKPIVKEERTTDVHSTHADEQRTSQEEMAQTFSEPVTRQSAPDTSTPSWMQAYGEDDAAADKSPSTPTEEEAFRIPEAPRTIKMEPTSPAIPDEASSRPGPDEEARTSVTVKEEPMEVDSKPEKSEEERTFQVPQEPEEQVNYRTPNDDPTVPPVPPSVESNSTSSEEASNERTQDSAAEPPVESDQVVAAEVRTPEIRIETEAVPESQRAAQESDTQVTMEIKGEEFKVEERKEQESSQEDHVDTKQVSNSSSSSSQGVEDGNKADETPMETTPNGNARTEQTDSNVTGSSTNHNTKNGEFSPEPQSPHPPSSSSNNELHSNCKSPTSNNIDEDGPSQTSTEERTDSNSSDTVANSESVAASDVPEAATDRTISR
ncbi:uncharacterized protein [Amphiura filiformis]